jgi:hypothetical protein
MICHDPVTDHSTVNRISGDRYMSLVSELSDLHRQHDKLEKELADVLAHPASTDAEIAEIKRRKLKLKDEIARLESGLSKAA